MAFEVLVDQQRATEPREHQPLPGRVRRDQLERGAAAERRADRPRRDGADVLPSALRISTTRQSSSSCGARVAKWTRTAVPSEAVAGSAAGIVAEMLITTTSPGASSSGRSVNVWWLDRPLAAPGDQQAHLVAGEAASLGRLVGLERGLRLERERGHAGTARSASSGSSRAR